MECEISEVRRSLRETAGEGRTKRCCIIDNLSRGTLSSYKRKCTRGVFLPGLIRRGFDSPQPNPYKQALSRRNTQEQLKKQIREADPLLST